ncbi:hypothetical protein [Streptomyces sp. NPDC048248]|uniref:hypothetical protein n=1 Tax=Streptomyces sp. NPDC048248 TaxID=3365523 RepID=UPI0037150B2E
MDSAVIAALITTPTAVLAAAAAYAAGRAQARAAHRGPVDAVRRQHQREAYAALVAETAKFESHMFRVYLGTIDPRQRHRSGTLAGEDNEALVFAAAAVRLEGPTHLADLARGIESFVDGCRSRTRTTPTRRQKPLQKPEASTTSRRPFSETIDG